MVGVKGLMLAAASSAAAAMMVAGCGGAGGPSASAPTSGPTTAPTVSSPPTDTTTSAPETGAPGKVAYRKGQCLNDSPTWESVPCTSSHYYEVTAVVHDDRYQGDLVKRSAYRHWVCDQKADAYLGGQSVATLLLADAVPPAGDPRSGERIVCLIYHAKPSDTGEVADTTSLKGALKGKGQFTYRICLAGKASDDAFHITPCDGPHVSEATAGFFIGRWATPYPGEEAINASSLKKCRPKDKAYLGGVVRDDISFAQNSSGDTAWSQGHHITTCFVQVDHGTVDGTMKGIGNKPLSTIR